MKTNTLNSLAGMPDDELIARITGLTRNEREATVTLVAHIAEFDRRRLYLEEGCASMFTYCTGVLHLSEHEAYGRITAARLARRFPVLLERLAEGSLHLTGLCLLAPVLTPDNLDELVEAARHRSKMEIRELVARIRPRLVPVATVMSPAVKPPAVPVPVELSSTSMDSALNLEAPPVRILATNSTTATPNVPTPPSVVDPLSEDSFRIHFTAGKEARENLWQLQNLLRHQIPGGDPAAILELALKVLLREVMRKKLAETDRPRAPRADSTSHTRTIPAYVKRKVWARDGGRCSFIARGGRRCAERGRLEFHHLEPYAAGGPATETNIELRCASHNRFEAELYFGGGASRIGERPRMYGGGASRLGERPASYGGGAPHGASRNSVRTELRLGET